MRPQPSSPARSLFRNSAQLRREGPASPGWRPVPECGWRAGGTPSLWLCRPGPQTPAERTPRSARVSRHVAVLQATTAFLPTPGRRDPTHAAPPRDGGLHLPKHHPVQSPDPASQEMASPSPGSKACAPGPLESPPSPQVPPPGACSLHSWWTELYLGVLVGDGP